MAARVRILGFPVTIDIAFPVFLAILAILGYFVSRFTYTELLIWLAAGTTAILLHELGHALAFRHYGLESSIQFWALGGLAIPVDQEAAAGLSDRQMLLVALAGPCVGLVLGTAGLWIRLAVAGQGNDIRFAAFIWIFVNLGWGLFNLLPISGLDGGQVLLHLLQALLGARGRAIALAASILSSALVAALALAVGAVYVALVVVIFGLSNPYPYRALADELWPERARRRRRSEAEINAALARPVGFDGDSGRAGQDGIDPPEPQRPPV
jgi:stage IV sporulation protein FB